MLKELFRNKIKLIKLTKICEWLQSSPKCSILLIYFAVLIDNLLLTSVGKKYLITLSIDNNLFVN
jgi:hypothetical protein